MYLFIVFISVKKQYLLSSISVITILVLQYMIVSKTKVSMMTSNKSDVARMIKVQRREFIISTFFTLLFSQSYSNFNLFQLDISNAFNKSNLNHKQLYTHIYYIGIRLLQSNVLLMFKNNFYICVLTTTRLHSMHDVCSSLFQIFYTTFIK